MYFDWPTRMLTKSETGSCNWIHILSQHDTETYLRNNAHFKSDQAQRVTNCFPSGRPSYDSRPTSDLRPQWRRSIRCTRFGWRTLQSSVGKRASDGRGIPSFTRPTLHGQIWDIWWSVDLSASAKDSGRDDGRPRWIALALEPQAYHALPKHYLPLRWERTDRTAF